MYTYQLTVLLFVLILLIYKRLDKLLGVTTLKDIRIAY